YVISKPTITLEDFDGVFVNLTEEAVCSDSGLELRESAVVARDAQENAEVSVEDMDLVDELLSDMKLNVILNLNKRRNLVMNYKMGKVMTAKVECSR
ncbi:MAG: hypothetical protein N4A33_10425, partial [Bacteriovoracaceae bacterium]|nr:hypothetical protein [Bacteriovoracaceae bacterium]